MIEAAPALAEKHSGPKIGRRRMCAVSRQVLPEDRLIRFVTSPEGDVVADLKARLPGRGMWLEGRRPVIEEARRKCVFDRALKTKVKVAEDLGDQVASLLKSQLLGRLGLAARARQVVCGFAKVEAALRSGEAICLVHAVEAAADGRNKLAGAARQGLASTGKDEPLFVAHLTTAELGLALGRPHVIHAAVLDGAAGRSFHDAALRNLRFDNEICQQPSEREHDIDVADRR
ncbi:RNA-binding protein [Rhodopseudomonas julia]|nr:RNA-binding protein [Rhodopseudomonas julia]